VLREPWRAHPLAWLHRAEARAIAAELGVALQTFATGLRGGPFLLRLSDPVMLHATQALTRAGIAYAGPGAAVMQLCYDKLAATRLVAAEGIDCPATLPASAAAALPFPLMLKPRRGCDSIGVRILRRGPLATKYRCDEYLVQELVRGTELTIAIIQGTLGAPLRIELPEGTPYSFARKYLLRPRREPVRDEAIGATALRITSLLGVDWAARLDFIREARSGRLYFLECDVAPMVARGSAFCESLLAAGVAWPEQLQLLLG
jgi:D-alanine-D-alanine ligase-like ATP-grasp enzyme